MADGVTVNKGSVTRAWREMGRTTVDVELRTTNCTPTQWDDALQYDNDRTTYGLIGGFPTPSPKGYLSLVDDAHEPDELDTWLTDLAEHLTAAGITGEIRGVTPPPIPEWLWAGDLYPKEPTGFIAWTIDLDTVTADPDRRAHWHLDPTPTQRLSEHLDHWTRPGGPNLHVARGVFNTALRPDADAGPRLASAVLDAHSASLVRFDTDTQSARATYLGPTAETTVQILGGDTPWQERIAALTDAITALPDITRLALIRSSGRDARSWHSLDRAHPLPGPSAAVIAMNHLDRYVPDAHGVQVLTDAHLERAHDLTGWHITDLGRGRHLVQAPDLAPWYADLVPNPDTLAQGRHDFGAMIITADTITNNPPPWTP